MKRHSKLLGGAILAMAMLGGAAAQGQPPAPAAKDDSSWAPFAIDHFGRQDSPADARFLLDGPAGKYGHVQARDGHLYLPNGKRFRCWGVNLTGWTIGGSEIPPHDEARVFADALARLGVNCVRFHFLDMPDKTQSRSG